MCVVVGVVVVAEVVVNREVGKSARKFSGAGAKTCKKRTLDTADPVDAELPSSGSRARDVSQGAETKGGGVWRERKCGRGGEKRLNRDKRD